MLILEYLPFGDLLGYLRRSRGHDDKHTSGELCPNSSLTSEVLCRFAYMVADGMSFLARKKVIIQIHAIALRATVGLTVQLFTLSYALWLGSMRNNWVPHCAVCFDDNITKLVTFTYISNGRYIR